MTAGGGGQQIAETAFGVTLGPAEPDPGHYDPALTARLEMGAATPMDTLKHDAEQRAIAQAQAAADGLKIPASVTFRGRSFTLGPCDSLAATLDFAEAAASGLDTDDPAGLAAMKSMLRDSFILAPSCGVCEKCVAEQYDACPQLDEGDWPRFWRLARATRADAEELMGVVTKAMEA